MMVEHFSYDKFKQVLHYIIDKCYDRHNVGKTILFKMLYFADFDYYELKEEALTGEEYRRIDYGPAPCHFDKAISDLKGKKRIMQTIVKRQNYQQYRYICMQEPDLSLLSADETRHIDGIVDRVSRMTAKQAVEYAHRDMPVKATEDKAVIDYELVFYRDNFFSVREYEDDQRPVQSDT